MHKSALKRVFLLVLAFLCLWSTAMCAVAASSKVKSLKLPSIAVIVKGNKHTLNATVFPAGTKITWESSNKRIATVNTNGKVTGVGIGEAKITATAGNKKASCTVRVVKKKGMYKDKGKTYYCNPKTGLLAKGLTTIGSAKYYFHPTKSYMLTGLQKIKGKTYYFAPSTGKMQKGLQTINKKLYFFDKSTGAQKTGMIRVNTGKTYNFLKKGGVTHGWLTSGSNTYYFHKTEGYMLTGLQKIDNDTYYFQKSKGYMLKGSLTIDKKKYYFDPTTGAQKTGLIKDEKGNCYNFLKEGGVSKGFTVIDSNTYYFNPSTGIMIAGKVREIPGGSKKFYYFAADTGIMQTGFQTVNDYRYYFDPQTGIAATGITKVEGDTYYFNENNARMKFGKQTVNGLSYFFDEQTGKQCTGFVSIKKDSNTYVYHYLPEGGISKGFVTIGSDTYYFNPDTGVMIAGKMREIPEGSKKFYYFAADTGIMQTGFQTVNDYRYYFDPQTGIAATGITKVEGDTYYFNEISARMKFGKQTVNGLSYFFDEQTGKQCTGFVSIKKDSNTYVYHYLPEGGMSTGFVTIGSDTYYFNPDTGVMVAGKVREIPEGSKKFYYFAADTGIMQTGFQTVEDKRYYFDPKTSVAALGLTDIDGKLYFFDENSGRMRMGQRLVNDKWYYFDPTTGQAINGVRKADFLSGSYYMYFDLNEASGCRMGLQEYESEYYFFHEVSYFAKEGFRTIGQSIYYFNPDNGYKANRNEKWNYKGVTLEANNKGVVRAISDDGSTRSRVLRGAFNQVGHGYGTGAGQYTCSSFVSGAYEYAGKSYLKLDNSRAENQVKLLLQNAPDCLVYTDTIPSVLMPGDLMFWEDPSCNDPNCDRRFTYNGEDYHIHHVSLYAGDNLVIEAADEELGTRITYMSDEDKLKLVLTANVIDSNLPANPEVDYSQFTTPSSLTSNAMGSMEGQEDAAQGSADESFMDELSIGEDELFPDMLDLSALELDLLPDDVEIGELMAPEGDLTLDAAQNQDSSMEFELELP